jgi:iron complex outermembrane receptor protein
VGTCAQCTVTDPTTVVGGATLAAIDGNPLPNAPKWIANFNLRYGIPTSSGGEYYVYTDWSYRSKVNFFLYESTEFTGQSLSPAACAWATSGAMASMNWPSSAATSRTRSA